MQFQYNPFTNNLDIVGSGGGGTTVENINVQTGTSPVVTSTNTITFNGAVVAAGTHPVRTDGTTPATMALEVQTSQAIASTDATKIGLAAFDSASFSVDANGFVTFSGSGGISILDGNTGSATGSTVTIETPASTGTMNFSGSGTILTLNLVDANGDLAIGNSATATGHNSVTLGTSATDNGGPNSVTIGHNATNTYYTGLASNVVIGNGAQVTGSPGTGANNSIAIGDSANAGAAGSCVVIGPGSTSNGGSNLLVGPGITDHGSGASTLVGPGVVGPSGGYTVAIGYTAGTSNTSGGSNITISNSGSSGESHVTRIGTQGSGNGQQNACYIAGIYNQNSSGFTSPLPVYVDSSTGQLGYGAGGGGITTLDGNSGSATGSTVTIATPASTGTLNFSGTSATLTLNLLDSSRNLAIGSGVSVSSPNDAIVLGTSASASSRESVVIGNSASDGGFEAVSVGNQAQGGYFTVAIGSRANCGGTNSIAIGFASGAGGGGYNVAIGQGSQSTGTTSVCVGSNAEDSGGTNNVSLGNSSLTPSGGTSVSLGYNAGSANNNGADNVIIANVGVAHESNVIRIGTQGTGAGQQNACYIAGIDGVSITGAAVLCSSSGQLGDVVSSLRFKEDVVSITDTNSLSQLKPVSFKYKSEKEKNTHFGLIAEEVEKVIPELVIYDKNKQPYSVAYHELPVLLLAEIQKLRQEVNELKAKI